jgi:GH35 family endo-1,4-beta-xylanase
MDRSASVLRRCVVIALVLALVATEPAAARTTAVQLGAAVNSDGFGKDPDPRYRATLAGYDAVTAESAMKIAELEPEQNRFEFGFADQIVAFAEDHGQQVHGHTLTWCQDTWLPAWLRDGDWTRSELLAVLEKYITTVVAHYRGRISSWDVVNEALNADGTERDCLWSRVIGPDWVEQAFRFARSADPDVQLFYNEIRAEVPNPKFDALLAMVRDFRDRGVPLDGVGEQMHLTGPAPPQAQIEETMHELGELGLAVQISELDVPTWYLGRTVGEKLARQADAYRTVAAACEAQPACFRVTTWGFTDRYTWRGPSSLPLPFDAEYRPKPAWTALLGVLRSQPAPTPPPAVTAVAPAPVPATSVAIASERDSPALSVKLRRQRRATWLRRHRLPIAIRLRSGEPAHVELEIRLHGRVIADTALDLAAGSARTVHLRVTAVARRSLLRRSGPVRLVVDAVATDGTGKQSRLRVRPELALGLEASGKR